MSGGSNLVVLDASGPLRGEVTRSGVGRPKAGFAVSVGAWLRGPVRPWPEELLDPDRPWRDGMLDGAGVRRVREQHRDARDDRPIAPWPMLMIRALREAC